MFTCLLAGAGVRAEQIVPRLEISYEALLPDTFSAGEMLLIDGDTTHYYIQVRRRGATSLSNAKPNLAVKIVDASGQKTDASFFGMRSDNYWVLDAMARDKARARNRASMDLWLEMARKPWYQDQEPELVNGYRGRMVVVTANGQPMGIYHLCERVDRKQLKLKKYSATKGGIRGLLYKAVEHISSNPFVNILPAPADTVATWSGYEVSYPDIEDGEPITWDPLYQFTNYVRTLPRTDTKPDLEDHIDLPVYIDYALFIRMLSARDNAGKNIYMSFYDKGASQKALISLWDIDHSWGRKYDGTTELATQAMTDNLYNRLTRITAVRDSLEHRYAELRQHIFTVQHLDSLIGRYLDYYAETGLDQLEAELWDGADVEIDIPAERAYIHQWLVDRLAYLDQLYHYQPPQYPIAGITTTAEYFTEEEKARCQRANPADSTITLIFDPKRFVLPEDSLIHIVYSYGTNTAWQQPVAGYQMNHYSSDSCFYTTLPYSMLDQPGNEGNPGLYFMCYYSNPPELDTTRVDAFPLDSGAYTVDPKLNLRDGGMMLMWPDDDIDELAERIEQKWDYAPLEEWDLQDTAQQALFGNFRRVPGTKNLYRSFHPFYPIIKDETAIRVQYAALCGARTGIRSAICLSGNQEGAEGIKLPCGDDSLTVHIPDYYQAMIREGNVLYVGQTTGHPMSYNNTLWYIDHDYYREWLTEIITFVNDTAHPLPIQMHCSLGADRTGSLSAAIAALCGASWEEIAADYEATSNTRRELYRHRGLIRYTMRQILGINPDEVSDLQAAMSDFVTQTGLVSPAELSTFVMRLQQDTIPTALPEQHVTIQSQMRLQNGQIIISRNGQQYTVIGIKK